MEIAVGLRAEWLSRREAKGEVLAARIANRPVTYAPTLGESGNRCRGPTRSVGENGRLG